MTSERKSIVENWHKKYKSFLKKFPMFKNEPQLPVEEEYEYYNEVAYIERIKEQCQNKPESKFINQNVTVKCHNLHKSLVGIIELLRRREAFSSFGGQKIYFNECKQPIRTLFFAFNLSKYTMFVS